MPTLRGPVGALIGSTVGAIAGAVGGRTISNSFKNSDALSAQELAMSKLKQLPTELANISEKMSKEIKHQAEQANEEIEHFKATSNNDFLKLTTDLTANCLHHRQRTTDKFLNSIKAFCLTKLEESADSNAWLPAPRGRLQALLDFYSNQALIDPRLTLEQAVQNAAYINISPADIINAVTVYLKGISALNAHFSLATLKIAQRFAQHQKLKWSIRFEKLQPRPTLLPRN